MTRVSYRLVLAVLCSTTALTLLSASPVLAQSNSSQAPVLPPPPTAALEPIATPSSSSPAPATTPVSNLNGNSQTTATPAPATPASAAPASTPTTAAPIGIAPTAQNMGAAQQQSPQPTRNPPLPTAEDQQLSANAERANSANPSPATTPAQTNEVAGAPIALPGMPATESALTMTPSGATTNIDPSLVGANATAGYDQEAYEMRLKERMEEIRLETRAKAVERAQENVFPLKPEEIESLLQQLRVTQAAIQKPIERPPATPRAVVHTMELDPGAQPPTIQLLNGNVTSLSILDATGQPWPIVDIAFGGPFDVKPPEAGGHIIRLSPLKEYAHGNMSVRLQKLPTPLTFSLEAGGQEVHYRFDARVPKLGPNAKTSLIDRGLTISAGEDSDLSAILVGTPPASAQRLKVLGVDGRTSAYGLNGSTYVRTPLTLLSPTWQSSVSSADGTNVYKLNDAPVLLLSDEGVMVRAQVQQPITDAFGLPDDERAIPDTSGTSTLAAGVR